MSSSPVSESGALAALATVLGVVWLWHVPRKKICQSTFWSTIVSCLPPVFSTKITNVTIFELPCAEGWETRTQDSAELPRKQIEPIQSGGNFWGSQIQILKKNGRMRHATKSSTSGQLGNFCHETGDHDDPKRMTCSSWLCKSERFHLSSKPSISFVNHRKWLTQPHGPHLRSTR